MGAGSGLIRKPVYFRVPTRVRLEPGCAGETGAACRDLGAERALLVRDPSLDGSHSLTVVRSSLAAAGVAVESTSALESNPRTTTVEALAALARGARSDVLIGMGGGSALDAAKAAAMLAANDGALEDYVGRDRYPEQPLPLIAIPTTCGTGSEVTWVSVISHEPSQLKLSVKGETMFPDYALVDADTLATLPPRVVAWTALDALTHALEAYTCRLANPISDAMAERAIALVFGHLRAGHADIAGQRLAREALMQAATIAGLAFGNADVAGVHCLSETLGGRWDVPHGMTNAILLGPVLRFHLPHIEQKLARLAPLARTGIPDSAPSAERAGAVLRAVERLVADVGIPGFDELGVGAEHFPWIAERAAANNSNPSNPQEMPAGNYLQILSGLATTGAVR